MCAFQDSAQHIFTQGVKLLKLGFAGTLRCILIETIYCPRGQAGHLTQSIFLWRWQDTRRVVSLRITCLGDHRTRTLSFREWISTFTLTCSCSSWHIYWTCEIIRGLRWMCYKKGTFIERWMFCTTVSSLTFSSLLLRVQVKERREFNLFLLVECFLGCQGSCSHLDLFSLKDSDFFSFFL